MTEQEAYDKFLLELGAFCVMVGMLGTERNENMLDLFSAILFKIKKYIPDILTRYHNSKEMLDDVQRFIKENG